MGPKVSLSSLKDEEYHLKLAPKYVVVCNRDDTRRLSMSVAIARINYRRRDRETDFNSLKIRTEINES